MTSLCYHESAEVPRTSCEWHDVGVWNEWNEKLDFVVLDILVRSTLHLFVAWGKVYTQYHQKSFILPAHRCNPIIVQLCNWSAAHDATWWSATAPSPNGGSCSHCREYWKNPCVFVHQILFVLKATKFYASLRIQEEVLFVHGAGKDFSKHQDVEHQYIMWLHAELNKSCVGIARVIWMLCWCWNFDEG